jgi:hypothetical protein
MKVRPIRVEGDLAFITLTKGYVAVIDATDIPLVDAWNWCAKEYRLTCYAQRGCRNADGARATISLHRTILRAQDGMEIDHCNRNGLDNRRDNLRLATKAENQWNRPKPQNNTSGFKGAAWRKDCKKWQAQIQVRGKLFYLGLFPTADMAHAAYAEASDTMHGEFGRI